jgi:hypothetical protein
LIATHEKIDSFLSKKEKNSMNKKQNIIDNLVDLDNGNDNINKNINNNIYNNNNNSNNNNSNTYNNNNNNSNNNNNVNNNSYNYIDYNNKNIVLIKSNYLLQAFEETKQSITLKDLFFYENIYKTFRGEKSNNNSTIYFDAQEEKIKKENQKFSFH